MVLTSTWSISSIVTWSLLNTSPYWLYITFFKSILSPLTFFHLSLSKFNHSSELKCINLMHVFNALNAFFLFFFFFPFYHSTCIWKFLGALAYGSSQARGQIGATAVAYTSSQRLHQVLDPLSHNGKSLNAFSVHICFHKNVYELVLKVFKLYKNYITLSCYVF